MPLIYDSCAAAVVAFRRELPPQKQMIINGHQAALFLKLQTNEPNPTITTVLQLASTFLQQKTA